MEEVIIKKGKKEGNTSVIIAGTHGNERCGVIALQEILPNLEIERGTVYFLYGNPKAIQQNKRFIEFNLNRAFLPDSVYNDEVKNTYEFKRSRYIMQYLDKASALLDLHSAQEDTKPFIFAEENAFEIIQSFPADFLRVVSGVEDIEPGGTDGYMSRNDKIGICTECGQHEDPRGTNLAKESIYAFLSARGHISEIPSKPKVIQRDFVYVDYAYYTKTDEFKLIEAFEDFSFLKKRTLIGFDGGMEVRAPYDGMILFARDKKRKHEEGFLFGRK